MGTAGGRNVQNAYIWRVETEQILHCVQDDSWKGWDDLPGTEDWEGKIPCSSQDDNHSHLI